MADIDTMSQSRSSGPDLRTALTEGSVVPSLSDYGTELKAGVRTIAFWSAIVLPFFHLPLLATGLDGTAITAGFALLVSLNVMALIVGQSHNTE